MRIRVLGHYPHVAVVALIGADVACAMAALASTAWIGGLLRGPEMRAGLFLLAASIFAMTHLLCSLALGVYASRQRIRLAGMVLRSTLSVGVSALAAYVVSLLAGLPDRWPAEIFEASVFALIAVSIVRVGFVRLLDDDDFKRRVLVYGAGRLASSIQELRRRSDRRGFYLVGYVPAVGERVIVPTDQVIGADGPLLAICRLNRVDEMVVAMDDRRRGFPVDELLDTRMAGIDVTEIVTFLERETGKVRLDVLNPTWIIFGEGFRRGTFRAVTTRMFDIASSVLVLLGAWPLMLLAALAIKLEDGLRAPIFYRQTRVGLFGTHFEILKFRSMRIDAEVGGRAAWAVKGDSRVTLVGALIRKTRIDEIPQILNVLKGDMSFVGPRPERPQFVEQLSERIAYYQERHCVRPGISGWAQLCYPYGSSERDAAEKLQYDLYYVKNQSFFFDLTILLQTAEVVLFGKGAR